MAKTNYDRVESAMDDGLLKMKADQLVKNSGKVSKAKKNVPKNILSTREKLDELAEERNQERRMIAAAMQYDVERLFKRKPHLYTELGTYNDEFVELVKAADSMHEEKWKRLMEIKAKLDKTKKIADMARKSQPDDTLVEKQRKQQVEARFNISKKWLPL